MHTLNILLVSKIRLDVTIVIDSVYDLPPYEDI